MTRSIQFFGKKRGDRRTVSSRGGALTLALFSAIFCAVGIGGLTLVLTTMTLPEWRANHHYVAGRCNVIDKRLAQSMGDDGMLYRPEVRIGYRVGGKAYDQWTYDATRMFTSGRDRNEALLAPFAVGGVYPFWYDPADPSQAVLKRGYSWLAWGLLLVPIPFLAVGGGGLTYAWLNWGKSQERRVAIAQRPGALSPLTPSDHDGRIPTMPDTVIMEDSPGTRLKFRLASTGSGFSVWGLLIANVVWNSVVLVLGVLTFRAHLAGGGDWLLYLVTAVFALAGIALLVALVRAVLVATGVSPTIVEISDHPLRPGGDYEMFVSQGGQLSLRSLAVRLVCEETVNYTQGTDTRTESCPVWDEELFCRRDFEVAAGVNFDLNLPLRIPASAMHSFDAEHNKISWKLVVAGDVARWPNFSRQYTVLVRPWQPEDEDVD